MNTIGIQIQNEELILISYEEEELLKDALPESFKDDEPFDVDKGSPDSKQMWAAGFRFPTFAKCEPDAACGQQHRRVRCRAKKVQQECEAWGMSNHGVAAHFIYQYPESFWKDINCDSITYFLFTLDKNLGETNAFRKELSRYGALRLGADEFVHLARQQDLLSVEVWRAVVRGQEYSFGNKRSNELLLCLLDLSSFDRPGH